MSFKTTLQKVADQCDGVLSVGILGFDGIVVDSCQPETMANLSNDLDLATAWVEYANMFSKLKQVAETLKTGALQEVFLSNDHVISIARILTPDYFLVLGLKPDANLGKARYLMRIAIPDLKALLS